MGASTAEVVSLFPYSLRVCRARIEVIPSAPPSAESNVHPSKVDVRDEKGVRRSMGPILVRRGVCLCVLSC